MLFRTRINRQEWFQKIRYQRLCNYEKENVLKINTTAEIWRGRHNFQNFLKTIFRMSILIDNVQEWSNIIKTNYDLSLNVENLGANKFLIR